MAHLLKIGNSQGVRISKPLTQQVQLEGKDLELKVVTPSKQPRAGWEKAIEAVIACHGSEIVDTVAGCIGSVYPLIPQN